MKRYKIKSVYFAGQLYESISRIDTGLSIPKDPANADYREYLDWLAEGNTPEPPDPPPPSDDRPTLEERIVAAETLINLILDEEAE